MNAAQPAIWKCLLTGGLAGFVNGFFGAGGGMIVVPLLILLVKLADKNAFSSAISIILPLTIVSLVIYAKNGALDVKTALPYLLGGAGGGILAGLWFKKVSARFLHIALGLLISDCRFGGTSLRRALGVRDRRRFASHGLADRRAVHGAAHGTGREPSVLPPDCCVFPLLPRQK